MTAYSLLELNMYLKRVLVLNFDEPLWVRAEIMQVKMHRGHTYIDLIQKDPKGDQICAQSQAILWARQRKSLQNKLVEPLHHLLVEGGEVSLFVDVQYHEVHSLSLNILDIDPAYTLGKLEQQRQDTIRQLREKQLIEKNKSTKLPVVIQRLAIISSDQAAGYQDFIQQLERNAFGYAFETQLFRNAMQGGQTEKELITNFQEIKKGPSYDCVLILRGGGSRVDLRSFDALRICEEIAHCPFPVLTGIGHETDTTIADLTAYQAFKTPTAAAAFIVDRNAMFESQLVEHENAIRRLARHYLQLEGLNLQRCESLLIQEMKQTIQESYHAVDGIRTRIKHLGLQQLFRAKQHLEVTTVQLRSLDPRSVMKRGFTLTSTDGTLVKSVRSVKKDTKLQTRFADGVATSVVKSTQTDE